MYEPSIFHSLNESNLFCCFLPPFSPDLNDENGITIDVYDKLLNDFIYKVIGGKYDVIKRVIETNVVLDGRFNVVTHNITISDIQETSFVKATILFRLEEKRVIRLVSMTVEFNEYYDSGVSTGDENYFYNCLIY